jgi:hypothetical protein
MGFVCRALLVLAMMVFAVSGYAFYDGVFALKSMWLGITEDAFVNLFPSELRVEGQVPRCVQAGVKEVKVGYDALCSYSPWELLKISHLFEKQKPSAPPDLLTFADMPVFWWEADFVQGKAVAISLNIRVGTVERDKSDPNAAFRRLMDSLVKRYGKADSTTQGGFRWLDREGNALTVWPYDPWGGNNQQNWWRVRVEEIGFVDWSDQQQSFRANQERAKRDEAKRLQHEEAVKKGAGDM